MNRLSLLSKEKNPVLPTRASATPLLVEGLESHSCTVAVMSIKRKVFRLAADIVIGFPPVADVPNEGGGVLNFSVFSDQAGELGRL